jgi:hypothetical protein
MQIMDTRSSDRLVAASLRLPALQELLLQAVRDWDTTGQVDGAPAHRVLTECVHSASSQGAVGFELEILTEESFTTREGLQQILSGSPSIGVMVTAIPETQAQGPQERCGKTFVILSLLAAR